MSLIYQITSLKARGFGNFPWKIRRILPTDQLDEAAGRNLKGGENGYGDRKWSQPMNSQEG
jgi:hypothetical protein